MFRQVNKTLRPMQAELAVQMKKQQQKPVSTRRKNRSASRHARPNPGAVEMLTIGWGLTVLTTLGCELGAAATMIYARWQLPSPWLETLSGTLVFAAVVTGLVGLALTVFVASARATPPPRRLLIFAVIVSLAPLFIAVERLSR